MLGDIAFWIIVALGIGAAAVGALIWLLSQIDFSH